MILRRVSAQKVCVGLIVAFLAVPEAATAQDGDAGHLGHHPGAGTPVAPTPAGPGMPGMTMSGSAGMTDMPPAPSSEAAAQAGGCCMGGGGAKPFYPALMDMPMLTPEARRFIEAEAARRLGTGSEAITIGQSALHVAMSANDPVAMQQVITGLREGVLLLQSGAAALQAVNEGQQPRQIALTWFKGQMDTPAIDTLSMDDGPWGLSWLHLITMAFLVAALLGAILIHYARLRRIDGLVKRLTPGGSSAPGERALPSSPTTGPSAAKPAPGGPAAPAKVQSASSEAPRSVAQDAAGATGGQSKNPVASPVAAAPGKVATRIWSGPLRVSAIFRETPAVRTFRLRALDGGAIPFTFRPGQFLSFSAIVDGKPIRRSYTIASSPTQHGYLEITVKREEHGAESRYLHDHVAVGDHLEVTGPSGVFTFTGAEADSIVLISGGVGITPMMCITRFLTDQAFPGEIFFLYGARRPEDFIFREELEYLEKRHANFHVAATMSKPDGTPWAGAVGRISKEFISGVVPDIGRRRIHVCGPPEMMDTVKAQLGELDVPRDKIKSEAFASPAPAPSPVSSATAPVPKPAAEVTAPEAPTSPVPVSPGAPPAPSNPPAVPSAAAQVTFSKSGKTGGLAPDQCVLEAAEAIGVSIDFVCRVGTCGTCVVPLLEGSVTMAVEDGLQPEDKARGIILACQAKSAANLVVDA